MKATLNKQGILKIIAETELESAFLENYHREKSEEPLENVIEFIRHDDI